MPSSRKRRWACAGRRLRWAEIQVWIEPEDPQFLVTAAGLCDSSSPLDGLLSRRQFEYGKATVKRGCPRVAALGDCPIGRNENGLNVLIDATTENVNPGSLRFIDHGVCIAALGKEIRYLAMLVLRFSSAAMVTRVRPTVPSWRRTPVAMRNGTKLHARPTALGGYTSLPAPPIGGPTLKVCNRENDQFVGFGAIYNRKLKSPGKNTPSAQFPRRPELRVRTCKSHCCFH